MLSAYVQEGGHPPPHEGGRVLSPHARFEPWDRGGPRAWPGWEPSSRGPPAERARHAEWRPAPADGLEALGLTLLRKPIIRLAPVERHRGGSPGNPLLPGGNEPEADCRRVVLETLRH